MKRRAVLLLTALGIMVAIAALALQKPAADKLLVLDWASKAGAETPPVAVLIEMGLKDIEAKPWSGKAVVTGAKVVHREGYRFRDDDKLTNPDGWKASSHRPLMAPKGQPATLTLDPFATVGVVLHLADIKPDATVSLSVSEQEIDNVKVPLKEILTGKPQPIQ